MIQGLWFKDSRIVIRGLKDCDSRIVTDSLLELRGRRVARGLWFKGPRIVIPGCVTNPLLWLWKFENKDVWRRECTLRFAGQLRAALACTCKDTRIVTQWLKDCDSRTKGLWLKDSMIVIQWLNSRISRTVIQGLKDCNSRTQGLAN
jgi:hypothetical protein